MEGVTGHLENNSHTSGKIPTDAMLKNRLIFISHANPEDNQFTIWLASRLACHGYTVWSDVTKLLGGEIIWDGIEDAIREHAAKTIVVLSQIAQTKQGVLDEVNLAVTTERSKKINNFVIPIRIDALPFSDVRANLARKNIIDCQDNWATGFKLLLKVLERDGAPKSNVPNATETSIWFYRVTSPKLIVSEPEPLMTNWIKIEKFPENLHFHRVPIADNKVRGQFETLPFPVYPYSGLVASFANATELNDGLSSWQKALPDKSVKVEAIFSDSPHSMPKLLRQEASNILHALLRTAWDKTMNLKGLQRYELSSGRLAWFPQSGHIEKNSIKYEDVHGKMRRILLVGHSKKYSVYWHFAVEAVPSIGRNNRMALKPHVVFTEDGKTPIQVVSKMQRLRRGFCRSWWNARWRDLLLAYTTMIADSSGIIVLEVGDGQSFDLIARPLILTAPFRLGSEDSIEEIEELEDTEEMLDDLVDENDLDEEDTTADDNECEYQSEVVR